MRTVLVLILLCMPITTVAQQGSVLYEQTVKLEIELPPEMAHMKDQIPSSQSHMKRLFFTDMASVLRDEVGEDTGEDMEMGDGNFRIRMMRARTDEQTYTHFDTGDVIASKDFLGRQFLVTDTPAPIRWRLTGEQAEFLGYVCQKAIAEHDSSTVEAWFTPEIPVPAGPAQYNGLPGLILVLTVDGDQRSYVAQALELGDVPEGTVVAPTKGKKLTRAEYEAIVEEKRKEMGNSRGRIIIRH